MESLLKKVVLVGVALLAAALSGSPALAQSEEAPNPLEVLIDAFEAPENAEFVAQFLREPADGIGTISDPVGDFEHSSGQEPGFTPGHIDITSTWALEFDPGPVDLFTPTDENQFWAPTGRFEVNPPNYPPFNTFSGDQVHDGSQYSDGALLFGFTLAETPPTDAAGRCEYVVWINDPARGPTFENIPEFPQDPATGTNVAFGLGLNPEDGPGVQSGFTLELQETGGFAPVFETDVRGFITPQYVGVFVPRGQISEIAAMNLYSFCSEEGFEFAPEASGADQTGLVDTSFDDFGSIVIVQEEIPVETTTTTVPPTTTMATPETTTAPAEEAETDDQGFPWWFVAMGGGLGLALLGWWLYNQEDDPCRKLLEAWIQAQRRCEAAQEAADEAADACDEAEVELGELEAERKEVCKAWPPACWSSEDGDWVEDAAGNRITSRDVHMRKVALGEVWADYKAGKLTASEVESRWREMDTPEFREEIRETDEAFKELLEEIDGDIADATERMEEACDHAEKAQADADEACRAAAEARRSYEECVDKAAAAAAPAGDEETPEEPDTVPPGAPAGAPGPSETAGDPCEGVEPKRRYERAGDIEGPIRVNVDFSVITGVVEGSERRVAEGEQLVIDLKDVASELDFMGDLLNARSAGLHISSAVNGYSQGKYVATAAGVVQGGIDATMATTDVVPDVPTTPLQAGVEGLEQLARLGAVITGKVTEWMTNIQVMKVHLTLFYQTITATPYTIWECRQGEGWVCVEKVWEIEVSRLKRHRGRDRVFTVNSDVRRREFQRVIRGMSQRAASTIRQDAERMARWRTEHEPGPCE